jgi:hypothetical protein
VSFGKILDVQVTQNARGVQLKLVQKFARFLGMGASDGLQRPNGVLCREAKWATSPKESLGRGEACDGRPACSGVRRQAANLPTKYTMRLRGIRDRADDVDRLQPQKKFDRIAISLLRKKTVARYHPQVIHIRNPHFADKFIRFSIYC